MEEFRLMNLDQRLLKAIADMNWLKPTEIQKAVIPLILAKKCVVVQAKTGSGKTAAFTIPIVHDLLQNKLFQTQQATSVIVLTPTKELCNQAYKNFRSICKYASKSSSFLDLSVIDDLQVLRSVVTESPDVVISTPSKLVALLRCNQMSLKNVKCIVVDEADLIFTFGHQTEMLELRSYLPTRGVQAILMSATLDDRTKNMRRCLVKNGDWIRIELPEESFLPPNSQLTQYIVNSEEQEKYTILIALLKLKVVRGKTLIFTNSVDRSYKLQLFLQEFGVHSALLNSELPVLSRSHTIDQFNRGLYDYLLATDESQQNVDAGSRSSKIFKYRDAEYGVSRGIDFQLVSNVINFDFPSTPLLYVHRVGRTARGDQMGTALSFVSQSEQAFLSEVETLLNTDCPNDQNRTNVTIFQPYQFRLSEVDGFRYRAMDVINRITRKVVREARLKEIKLELLNSDRLKGYFEDHTPDLEALRHDKPLIHMTRPQLKDVPDYIVPQSLKSLLPGYSQRKRHRVRTRQKNNGMNLNDSVGTNDFSTHKKFNSNPAKYNQVKHRLNKKRKSQNPLFSFNKKWNKEK